MNKKVAYKILPDKKLIIEYFGGTIFVDDFIQEKKVMSLEPEYDPNFNSIFDFRDADIHVQEEDMITYLEFLNASPEVLGNRKTAYLTTTPDVVAVTTIFTYILEEEGAPIHSKVFSTIGALIKWLGIKDIEENQIVKIFHELKTQSNNVLNELFNPTPKR